MTETTAIYSRFAYPESHIPIRHLDLDVTMDVALTNLSHGLRKLRYVLAETGNGDAFFIPTPDFSTTSNPARWKSGFSYGGALLWKNSRPTAFPELRPNACGVLLGRQEEPFCLRSLSERISKARIIFKEDWDYDRHNHFIGLYRDHSSWYFLLHGGTKSIKSTLGLFEGASTDPLFTIYRSCQLTATPFGPLYTLHDDPAMEYFFMFKSAEAQIKKRRECLASFLFPDSRCTFHETHQGLISPTAMALGAYLLSPNCQNIPLMIAPGEPLLIVERGSSAYPDSISREAIEIIDSLPEQGGRWIAPHGSGDYLVDLEGFSYSEELGKRLFFFNLNDGSQVVDETPCSLREGYRSRKQAISAVHKLGMKIVGALEHIATLKV
jgi:hypothetical protein